MTTILDSALTMPRTCVAADQVIALDSVGSTNTYAAELVRKGALFGSTSEMASMAAMDAIGPAVKSWRSRRRADRPAVAVSIHQWTSAVGESFIVSLVVSVPTAIVRDTSVNGWLQMIAGCEARNAIIAGHPRLRRPARQGHRAQMAERHFRRRQETGRRARRNGSACRNSHRGRYNWYH